MTTWATDDLSGTFLFGGLSFGSAGNVFVAAGGARRSPKRAAAAIALNNPSNHLAYFYVSRREGAVSSASTSPPAPRPWRLSGVVEARRARLRAQRGRLAASLRAERDRAEAADGVLAGWYDQVEAVFLGFMAAAGYHRHKRQWRKRRMNSREKMQDFFDRVAAGDPGVRDHLRRLFDAAPDAHIALFRGDLAARVVEGLVRRVAGEDLGQWEAVLRKLERVRVELAGPDPTPVEALLAERAAVGWLAVYEAELSCQKLDTGPREGGGLLPPPRRLRAPEVRVGPQGARTGQEVVRAGGAGRRRSRPFRRVGPDGRRSLSGAGWRGWPAPGGTDLRRPMSRSHAADRQGTALPSSVPEKGMSPYPGGRPSGVSAGLVGFGSSRPAFSNACSKALRAPLLELLGFPQARQPRSGLLFAMTRSVSGGRDDRGPVLGCARAVPVRR